MNATPSLGRTVLFAGEQARSNGADVAPAVITRVWAEHPEGGWLVNLQVLPDNAPPVPATSVRLVDDEDTARAAGYAAWWPPRV